MVGYSLQSFLASLRLRAIIGFCAWAPKNRGVNRGFLLKNPERFLEPHRTNLGLGGTLLQGARVGIDEVANRADHNITQGDISVVCNGLQHILFVRGNADCHDPIASFRHEGKLIHSSFQSTKNTIQIKIDIYCITIYMRVS